MTRFWPHSCFCMFMERDLISVHKHACKKRTWSISNHLDRTSFVNNPYTCILAGIRWAQFWVSKTVVMEDYHNNLTKEDIFEFYHRGWPVWTWTEGPCHFYPIKGLYQPAGPWFSFGNVCWYGKCELLKRQLWDSLMLRPLTLIPLHSSKRKFDFHKKNSLC